MTISVIIPAHNAEATIGETLASVFAQTRQPDEIIVVDDGSRDRTADLVRSFGPRVKLLQQDRGGVASARNRGIETSSGDLIAFLDADDVWHPQKLELQCAILDQRPRLQLVGTETYSWPDGIHIHERLISQEPRTFEVSWKDLVVRNYFTNSSVLVDRGLLDSVGSFDASLQGPEDYDLWVRCAEIATVAILTLPLTGYRESTGGLGSDPSAMSEGLQRIRTKLLRAGLVKRNSRLHRKAESRDDFSCAYLYRVRERHDIALYLAFRSMLRYPLPFRRCEIAQPFARLRLTTSLCWYWARSLAAKLCRWRTA